jgi:hypothetical protein
VLACLATGKTNRAIAETLFISEKTVARHLSNIFTKLDLATRAEATAYAYQHDLVRLGCIRPPTANDPSAPGADWAILSKSPRLALPTIDRNGDRTLRSASSTE